MFKASKELLDILLKNEFRNKSYDYVNEWGDKYRSRVDYNPQNHKRVFGLGDGKRRLIFDLDYTNISVIERSSYITNTYTDLSECKLRSIIAYFKCTYSKKQAIKEYTCDRIEDAGCIMKEERKRNKIYRPLDESFEQLYKSVIL
jgi:hypothetical protein